MTKALQAALSTVAWACSLSAHADCAPIIAAYAKAESTGRSAVYDVASMQAAPKGKPFHVHVGGVGYTDVGDHWQKGGGGNAALEGSSLKGREQNGEVRCEPIGESRIAGDAVVGYQIRRMTRALPIRWRSACGSAAQPVCLFSTRWDRKPEAECAGYMAAKWPCR